MIVLEEPVQGITSVTVTDKTQIVSEAGQARKLQDIKPGTVIEATGPAGGSGSVLATLIRILSAPPATSVPSGWQALTFDDMGVRLQLPASWSVVRQKGGVLAGPGLESSAADGAAWFYLALIPGAPQTLPELMKAAEQRMADAHVVEFTTTRMNVGGYDGVAIRWTEPAPRDPSQPGRYLDLSVPAYGRVHQFVFHPPLLEVDGKRLKGIGQTLLDSIRFFGQ